MEIRYYKEHSWILNRDMEFKIYGRSGGKLCIAFAPENGRFYDYENFGMIESLAPWIESGRLQVVTPDSIDAETWNNQSATPRQRIEQQERWFRYITDELFGWVVGINGHLGQRAIVTGCSMGATHSSLFFFRRPDLFDTLIAQSGIYNASHFFHNYMDNLIYENSPVHFLPHMDPSHFYMALYRSSRIICCSGQGAWEKTALDETHALERVLKEKDIPAWFDYWGLDVGHEWYWWKKQMVYHMEKLMPW